MRNEIIIEDVKHIVADKLRNEATGHDWWHTLRVYNTSMDIAAAEGKGDRLIIGLAALLHDVADHKFGYTDADREAIITDILTPFELSDSVIEQVIYIVNNLSFKQGKNKHVLETIEGRIVQDADVVVLDLCRGAEFVCHPELLNRKPGLLIGLVARQNRRGRAALPLCLKEIVFVGRDEKISQVMAKIKLSWILPPP